MTQHHTVHPTGKVPVSILGVGSATLEPLLNSSSQGLDLRQSRCLTHSSISVTRLALLFPSVFFFFSNTPLKAVQPAQLCLLDAGRLPPFN